MEIGESEIDPEHVSQDHTSDGNDTALNLRTEPALHSRDPMMSFLQGPLTPFMPEVVQIDENAYEGASSAEVSETHSANALVYPEQSLTSSGLQTSLFEREPLPLPLLSQSLMPNRNQTSSPDASRRLGGFGNLSISSGDKVEGCSSQMSSRSPAVDSPNPLSSSQHVGLSYLPTHSQPPRAISSKRRITDVYPANAPGSCTSGIKEKLPRPTPPQPQVSTTDDNLNELLQDLEEIQKRDQGEQQSLDFFKGEDFLNWFDQHPTSSREQCSRKNATKRSEEDLNGENQSESATGGCDTLGGHQSPTADCQNPGSITELELHTHTQQSIPRQSHTFAADVRGRPAVPQGDQQSVRANETDNSRRTQSPSMEISISEVTLQENMQLLKQKHVRKGWKIVNEEVSSYDLDRSGADRRYEVYQLIHPRPSSRSPSSHSGRTVRSMLYCGVYTSSQPTSQTQVLKIIQVYEDVTVAAFALGKNIDLSDIPKPETKSKRPDYVDEVFNYLYTAKICVGVPVSQIHPSIGHFKYPPEGWLFFRIINKTQRANACKIAFSGKKTAKVCDVCKGMSRCKNVTYFY